MKLISMTDFVLEQSKIGMEVQSISHQNQNRADRFYKIVRYANFLKQPLELWMFVPCDDNGNVLEEECIDEKLCKYCPLEDYRKHNSVGDSCEGSRCDVAAENYRDEYQQEKERCLFEGFEFQDANEDYPMPFVFLGEDVTLYPEIFDETSNVEDLVYYSEFIQLTPIAQKQIGCDH